MENRNKSEVFKLMYVIVNHGSGSRILHKAKEFGIAGGTIVLSKGTVNSALLQFLALNDERKEMVMMSADSETAEYTLEQLNRLFHFEKPNHGIAFTTQTAHVVGSSKVQALERPEILSKRGADKSMYQLIITIVDRGKAEDVIDAAKEAGSKGGTIVNARGSGIHETSKLFHMDIEPEKEIVYILSKKEITDSIVTSIRKKTEIDKPGNGVIFIQDVNDVYGLYE